MRRLLLLSASCLVLGGTGARAETYEILEGTLTSTETGTTQALTGAFDVSPFDPPGSMPDMIPLHVDDFAFQAGDRGFTPNGPIEFEGLSPTLFLEVADQINLRGADVGLIRMRSGGELVGSGDERVTFRFLDFRSGPAGGGQAIGQLGEGVLPRRLQLEGTLYEIDQTFRIHRGPCLLPAIDLTPRIPPTPPAGGGVILIGDRDIVAVYERFEILPVEIAEFVQPGGGARLISRVTGPRVSTIEGELLENGGAFLGIPGALELGPADTSTTPTLEELGISAPDGAVFSYDGVTGELTVTSEGDIFIEGTAIDLPGVTILSISTPGNITISGMLILPPEIALRLEAGVSLLVEGSIEAPGGGILIPAPDLVPIASCPGLSAITPPTTRAVGSFSLVASAARQIDIDVHPGRRRNRVRLGRPQRISVAILGSDDLDVRDIDVTSLRLGPGEAEPASRRGRHRTRRGYANRDRYLDLLARFDVRDTEIAFGATQVCLVAETNDGETLEGCDVIQTLPFARRAGSDRKREQALSPRRTVQLSEKI